MKRIRSCLILLGGILAIAPLPALAQNTAGVFGPVVKEGTSFAEARLSVVPDRNGETAWAQRYSYERAINGDFKWRLLAQVKDPGAGDAEFDYARAELFWQMTPDENSWQSGFRFDARLSGENQPGQLGAHWTNQIKLDDGWQTRFIVLSAVEVGDNARDGVFLQTRANLSKKLENGLEAGVEMYNNYGSTDALGSFQTQRHQAGPFASTGVGDDWKLFGSVLFGLSDRADDLDLRLRVGRDF